MKNDVDKVMSSLNACEDTCVGGDDRTRALGVEVGKEKDTRSVLASDLIVR